MDESVEGEKDKGIKGQMESMEYRYGSYCGIYCGACEIVIARKNGQLEDLARRAEKPVEQLDCDGCKSEKLARCCTECKIRACAMEKGYANCLECDECPCEHFDQFKKGDFYPLYVLMINNFKTIKKAGQDAWLKQQEKRWECTTCGTPFWWYQKNCESCGKEIFNCEAEAAKLDDS
ncbi:DUF3795 domain-containing protein [bacterium]|nr:DUF3795 domain-containing protein [bacterium]